MKILGILRNYEIFLISVLFFICINENLSLNSNKKEEPTDFLARNNIKNELNLSYFNENNCSKPRININEEFDLITNKVSVWLIQNYNDFLNLPNIDCNFNFVSLNLCNGSLYKMSTMYRYEDLSVTYKNQTILLHVPIGFSEIQTEYDYLLNIVGGKRNGHVLVNLKNIKFSFDLLLNYNNSEIELTKYNMDCIGTFSVQLSGKQTDCIINRFIEILIFMTKYFIKRAIESELGETLKQCIDTINTLPNLKFM